MRVRLGKRAGTGREDGENAANQDTADNSDNGEMGELTIDSARMDAKQALEALKSFSNTDLVNLETGITARVNSEQRNKIISNAAVAKSVKNGFTGSRHNAAAAKIDKIFKHASLVETSRDKSGDANIASIKRFVSPVIFCDETALAYLTVKESIEHGHRIYSLELLKIEKTPPQGGTPKGDTTGRVSKEKITQLLQKVNPSGINK